MKKDLPLPRHVREQIYTTSKCTHTALPGLKHNRHLQTARHQGQIHLQYTPTPLAPHKQKEWINISFCKREEKHPKYPAQLSCASWSGTASSSTTTRHVPQREDAVPDV